MKKRKNKTLITIVIPTFNEEKRIGKLLKFLKKQNFNLGDYEVIVVDDDSTDKTQEIVKSLGIKIIRNGFKDAEVGKLIAYKASKSTYFLYLDADILPLGTKWLEKMVLPLEKDSALTGSFTKFVASKKDNSLQRYYNLDTLQRDPIFQFFSPGIEEKIISSGDGYQICEFQHFSVPPIGICVHRRKLLNKYLFREKKFMELDIMARLVDDGYNRFAYVNEVGIHHESFSNLKQLLKKRMRNVHSVYLSDIDNRHYTWFNLSDRRDFIKVIVWVVFANSLLLPFVSAIIKAYRYKTMSALWEVIITPLITDFILLSFLTDNRGRKLVVRGLKNE